MAASDTEAIKGPRLLKTWDNWEAGIGYPLDDGVTPGMFYSSGLLGTRGELRPAPVATDISDPGTAASYVTVSGSSAVILGTTCVRPASGTTVAFDAASTGKATGTGSGNIAHTVTSGGSNRAIFVGVSADSSDATGVTYDGDALTKIGSKVLGSGSVSIWRKTNPSTGTNNIVVTFAGSQDMVVGGLSFTNVHQTTPAGAFINTAATIGTDHAGNIDTYANGEVILVTKATNVTVTTAGDDTERWNDVQNSAIRGVGATYSVNANNFGDGGYQFQYFFDDVATSDATKPFLYYVKGTRDGTNLGYWVGKVDIGNASMGTGLAGAHKFSSATAPLKGGQPARYEGIWRFPKGNLTSSGDLTTIGTGAISTDTLASSGVEPGDDHLTMIGGQLAGIVEDGSNPGGARILKINGNPQTEGDWGQVFDVGDKNSRAAGLRGLGGLAFVMNVEGLYSFGKAGRSGLVFEDFREWRNIHDNIPLGAWKGGIAMPHPSGLLFYRPGQLPVNMGLGNKSLGSVLPPTNATELLGGLYHSTATAGNFLYALYQPDPSSTSLLALCAYEGRTGIVWQALGTATLNDLETMSGCTVSTLSRPRSASYATPTFWYGDAGTLTYTVLGGNASPFRTRGDTHAVLLSANAFMSEIFFDTPTDLSEIVVYTENMASGDQWQIRGIANNGTDVRFGAPIIRDGRTVLKVNLKDVYRFMLRTEWTATSTSARVPPIIKRIELYGRPS